MNVVKEIGSLNKKELENNLVGKGSWHDDYKDSAYIFVGGLPFDLTEGDIITIFSQFGEIMDVNLVKDQKTGKSKGFAFLAYQDQRSTVLAVDNFNGAKILERIIRVDHVKDYKKKGKVNEDGVEEIDFTYNAAPQIIEEVAESSDEEDHELAARIAQVDLEDPMAPFMIKQIKKERKKELKKLNKKDSKSNKKKKHHKRDKETNDRDKVDDLYHSRGRDEKDKELIREKYDNRSRSPRRFYRNKSRSHSPASRPYREQSGSPARDISSDRNHTRYIQRSPSPPLQKSAKREGKFTSGISRSQSPIDEPPNNQYTHSKNHTKLSSNKEHALNTYESSGYRNKSRLRSPTKYESKYTRSFSRTPSPSSSPLDHKDKLYRDVSRSPPPKQQSAYDARRRTSRSPTDRYSKSSPRYDRASSRKRSRSPYRPSSSRFRRESSSEEYKSNRHRSRLPQ